MKVKNSIHFFLGVFFAILFNSITNAGVNNFYDESNVLYSRTYFAEYGTQYNGYKIDATIESLSIDYIFFNGFDTETMDGFITCNPGIMTTITIDFLNVYPYYYIVNHNCTTGIINRYNTSPVTSFTPQMRGVVERFNVSTLSDPVNGACGTNQGYLDYETTSYSGTFCSSGTASPSSPAFPTAGGTTTWSCQGSNGGTNASCSVQRANAPVVNPVNGACGTRATSYANTTTSYPAGTFCSSGTASPSSPAFPTAGGTTTWSCQGSNGGTNISCNATRVTANPVNGSCGTLSTTYSSTTTSYPAGTFCSSGTASPSSPAFPTAGGTTTWSCQGSNGGTNATCQSTKNASEDSGWFPSFDGIIDSLVSIGDSFAKILDFSIDWVGFNFDFSKFSKIFYLNLDRKNLTINQNNCSTIFNDIQLNFWHKGGGPGNPIPPTYPIDNILAIIPDIRIQSPNFCPGTSGYSRYFSSTGWNGGSPNGWCRYTYEKKFNYLSGYESPVIGYDKTALTGINIIPFRVVFFGVDIFEKLQEWFYIFTSFIFDIITIPVNMLNSVMNVVNVININFAPEQSYCFNGGKVKIWPSMMTGTRIDHIIDWTNENEAIVGFGASKTGIGGALYILALMIASWGAFRRIRKINF